jgi:hypothetical protein
MDLRKYAGLALLGLTGLWQLGIVPHAPHYVLSDGRPTWAELRDPSGRASALETRLGLVAESIAGRSVGVRCEDLSDVHDGDEPGGVVRYSGDDPANYARIRLDICAQLRQVMRDRGAAGAAEARAVEVLAHESFHLRGVKDEAAAECYAIQFIPLVARGLRATNANARLFRDLALRAYPYHPSAYVSSECRPGGALDLHGSLPRAR